MPELGKLDRKQIAALVGIAPLNRDSGLKKGRRTTWGGRASVRAVLYMSTLVATRHNPVIHDFYNHLMAQGKLHKVAMTASMRKLLTMLNAMIRDQSYWQPEMAHNQALKRDRASAGFFTVFTSFRKHRWVLLLALVAWHRQFSLVVSLASETEKA